MRYFVMIRRTGTGYSVDVSDVPGCVSTGLTVEDARQQIAEALKQAGTPVWLMIANDEGHGYRKKPNQDFQFYATVEFLQEYLLK